MGTILKYALYAVIIFVLYAIGVSVYEGKINKNTTVQEVGEQVKTEAQETSEAIQEKMN